MSIDEARSIIVDYQNQDIDALGDAIATLKMQCGSYENIATQVGVPSGILAKYHRLSTLPLGIQWKIKMGELLVGIAKQIVRLKNENDQWLLAFVVVDSRGGNRPFSINDCQSIVNEVLRNNRTLEVVLEQNYGVNLTEKTPLILSFDYMFRYRITRASWNKKENWADLVYHIVNDWLSGREFMKTSDLRGIARELKNISEHIESVIE